MSVASAAQSLIDEFQSRPTLRAGSLITTVFGDAIAPRGGSIWLGSLIRIMREFGINERLVRTSVYRLSRDGWFVVSQVGRRSYYSLSNEGERKFEHATKRIYSEPVTPWSGDWTLILMGELQHEQKEWLRKETAWLGFAAVGRSVLAHPGSDAGQLEPLLKHSNVAGKVVVMQARTLGSPDQEAMRELVRRSWNLDDIDRRYADFIEHFKPALGAVRRSRKIFELDAMQIRTLLIQEYRKALLRDPLLPVELLPDGWHGTMAYELCRELYMAVHAAADAWLTSNAETVEGPLPPPSSAYYERFGGLSAAGGEV